MEISNRKLRCCFTGHRPEKLNITEKEAKALLCSAIENAISRGFTAFITGMAPGIDIWAGEMVMHFKTIYPHIKLICALPYPTFYKGRREPEQLKYQKILAAADFVHVSCPSYSRFSYQLRNMWMVDNSSLVIAFFSGEPGGTRNTINYAKKEGIEIINLLE